MESYLVDVTDELQLGDVVAAYWDLSSPELLCAPGFDGPELFEIKSGKFQPILCKHDGKILGVMVVKVDENGIYYPAMKGNRAAVLESMVECAQDNYDYLVAQTDNQYIHELAESIDKPMTREGNTLRWNR